MNINFIIFTKSYSIVILMLGVLHDVKYPELGFLASKLIQYHKVTIFVHVLPGTSL